MKTIIEDICDIISTIMPDEEEIKIYKQRCDNIFFADMLLDILVSNLIFKLFVVRNASTDEEYNAPSSVAFLTKLKQVFNNEELNKEWLTFSRLHIEYVLTWEDLNPSVRKFLEFEFEYEHKDIFSETEIWEQGDNEELIFDYLTHLTEKPERIKTDEQSLRILLEGIVILHPHILVEERFQELIGDNMKELRSVLALENF